VKWECGGGDMVFGMVIALSRVGEFGLCGGVGGLSWAGYCLRGSEYL
jgi:hypothetical protein